MESKKIDAILSPAGWHCAHKFEDSDILGVKGDSYTKIWGITGLTSGNVPITEVEPSDISNYQD